MKDPPIRRGTIAKYLCKAAEMSIILTSFVCDDMHIAGAEKIKKADTPTYTE